MANPVSSQPTSSVLGHLISKGEQGLPKGEVLLRLFVQEAPAAIAMVDGSFRLLLVSRQWERRFGTAGSSLEGRTLLDVFEDPGGFWKGVFDQALQGTAQEGEGAPLRHQGKDHAVRWAVQPWYLDEEAARGFLFEVGEQTPWREERDALRKQNALLRLREKVAAAANEADTAGDVLQVALDQLCAYTGWPLGHAFLAAGEGAGELEPSGIWHGGREGRFEVFREVTGQTRLRPGQGLPGRVVATGKPVWVTDLSEDATFPRAGLASSLGIVSAFAFPVRIGDEIAAVLEFFSERTIPPDDALLDVLGDIGVQVGRVIQRQRAEEALRASEERFRTLTATAVDAIVTSDSEGRITAWNRGAERIFGYAEEEVRGRPLTLLMPERYAEAHEQGMHRATTTGETRVIGRTVELYGVRRSGEEFPLELSISRWNAEGQTYFTGILRDITDRKEAQGALQASQDLLGGILASSQDGIMAFRALRDAAESIVDFEWLLSNPRGAELVGRPSDDLVGKRLLVEMPAHRELGLWDAYVRVVETGTPFVKEVPVEGDGETMWFYINAVRLGDGFTVTFRNVTQRKRAEEALYRSEALLRRAQQLARFGSWEWDIQTGELLWSDELCRIYGLAPGQKPTFELFMALVHPDDRALMQAAIEQAMQTRTPYTLQHRIVRPDGVERLLHAEGEVVVDAEGRLVKMIGTGQDVTETRRREEQLRQSEERFRLLAENTSDLVCLLDPAGRFLYVSPSVERILGFQVDEVMGGDVYRLLHPDDRERLEQEVRDNIRLGLTHFRSTFRCSTKGGAYVWLETTTKPLLGPEGEVADLQTSSRDVSDRVQAEHALTRTNRTLEQRNRELQDFAYVASHDLQEPLRKIRAFADLVREDYKDVIDETGRYYLDRMQDAAARMSSLINDLLAFSRVTTKGKTFGRVNLSKVASDVLSDLEMQVRETGATVTVGDLPTIDGDVVQMRQLLQNLLSNALKFHRPGEAPVVAVRAAIERGPVFSDVSSAEGCRLEVQDNGIGFDERYLDRVFTPFQRLHNQEEYAGTGMGLAICRRIVERHHGTITAQSQPGRGTTFIVLLPLHQADPPPDETAG